MRYPLAALAMALAAVALQAQAQTTPAPAAAATTPLLTLSEAIRLAESANPALRARQAQLFAAEGLRQEAASPLFNNPQLTLEQTRRRPSGAASEGSSTEPLVGIAQPFELGGQQSKRRDAAAAVHESVRAEIEDARVQARAEATLRFNAVLVAQRRVQLEERALALFESSAQAVAKRREAGEDTRLDANVARIESERARNALAVAREQLLNARAELAAALQLPAAQLPQIAGDASLSPDHIPAYSIDQLLAAVPSLSRLRALSAREAAARARLAVEQGNRLPDVTVGVNVGREGPAAARERVTTFTVSLPLPLFRRNQAGIGQALTELNQAEIDRSVGVRDGEATVRRLWLLLGSQAERVQRLRQAMVPAALDNQQLASRSRQAGQIGLLDQLLVNRQALDAERELNEAVADFHNTRIELERAAGWSQEGQAR